MLRAPHVLVIAGLVVVALGSWAGAALVGELVSDPSMSEASMKLCVSDWFAEHPAHGAVPLTATAPPPADTFLVSSFRFDTDGRSATQVDTMRIVEGQTVMFKHVDGFHTTTSGKPTDVDAGSLWDLPVDPSSTEAVVDFPTAGTYPFFCRPHGQFFNMRGVIVVSVNTARVEPGAARGGLAFVGGPIPNPSRAGVSFRFRVDREGDVGLRIFDASGRAVARVLDAPLAPGVHEARWNARRADGSRARAGVYFAKLEAHGASATVRVTLTD